MIPNEHFLVMKWSAFQFVLHTDNFLLFAIVFVFSLDVIEREHFSGFRLQSTFTSWTAITRVQTNSINCVCVQSMLAIVMLISFGYDLWWNVNCWLYQSVCTLTEKPQKEEKQSKNERECELKRTIWYLFHFFPLAQLSIRLRFVCINFHCNFVCVLSISVMIVFSMWFTSLNRAHWFNKRTIPHQICMDLYERWMEERGVETNESRKKICQIELSDNSKNKYGRIKTNGPVKETLNRII